MEWHCLFLPLAVPFRGHLSTVWCPVDALATVPDPPFASLPVKASILPALPWRACRIRILRVILWDMWHPICFKTLLGARWLVHSCFCCCGSATEDNDYQRSILHGCPHCTRTKSANHVPSPNAGKSVTEETQFATQRPRHAWCGLVARAEGGARSKGGAIAAR